MNQRPAARPHRSEPSPAVRRLAALAPLDGVAEAALALASERRRIVGARREVLKQGAPLPEPLLVLSGWAARVRYLEDGRRQIMGFLLPGDVVGLADHARPLAPTTVLALTEVAFCHAPPGDASPALAQAYALGRALEEAHLLGQITRLGRMNAEERMVDLFLELHERLDRCGLVSADGFPMPLTQESLADALGLTSVHVNRTLQQLRRRGEIRLTAGSLTLGDTARAGRGAVARVSAEAVGKEYSQNLQHS